MKKLFYFLLPLSLIILLSSCFNNKNIENNNHEYKRHYDDNYHYDECECGDIINKEVHHFNEVRIITDATCITDGLKELKCSKCGYTKEEVILAIGHEYGNWITETDATCISVGKEKHTCIHCGISEYRDIEKTEHLYIEGTSKESTCTEHGHTAGVYCKYCHDVLEEESELPLKDHDYTDWETITPATCTNEGLEQKTCNSCGHKETRQIPKTSHELITIEAIESTCSEYGHTEGIRCKNCDYVEKESVELPLLSHNYVAPLVIVNDSDYWNNGEGYYACSVCGNHKNVTIRKKIFSKTIWENSLNLNNITNTTILMNFIDNDLNKNLTLSLINNNNIYYISIKDNSNNKINYYYYNLNDNTTVRSIDNGYVHDNYDSSADNYIKYRDILLKALANSSNIYQYSNEIEHGYTSDHNSINYKDEKASGTTTINYDKYGRLTNLSLEYGTTTIFAEVTYSSNEIIIPQAIYHSYNGDTFCDVCGIEADCYNAYKENYILYYYITSDNVIQFEYEMDDETASVPTFTHPTLIQSDKYSFIKMFHHKMTLNNETKDIYIYVFNDNTVISDYDSDDLDKKVGVTYVSYTDAGILPDGTNAHLMMKFNEDLTVTIYKEGISSSMIVYEGPIAFISGNTKSFRLDFVNNADNEFYHVIYNGNIVMN